MSGWKKLASAAAASGEVLNVEDVFSTYLYTAEFATAQTINNGVDLDSNGGLIWFKKRVGTVEHGLFDSTSSFDKYLSSNTTDQATNQANHVNPTTTGFTLSSSGYGQTNSNDDGGLYASWTFRKAPKFFDVVTYTGNGVNGRSISHSLNHTVGMIIIKCSSASSTNWVVWHRGASGTLWLNSTNADSANGGGQATSGIVYNPGSNTTSFTVDGGANVNQTGRTYVAYLFAHNNSDGEFGPTGDQDIIKCGSFTTDGNGHIGNVSLGFEPQFILTKRTSANQSWFLFDTMRGLSVLEQESLSPDTSGAETNFGSYPYIYPTADGFAGDETLFGGNQTVAYIAIRRGPMAVPEDATDVFAIDALGDAGANPTYYSGFPVDFVIQANVDGGDQIAASRLTGTGYLRTNKTDTEGNLSWIQWDLMDGWGRLAAAVSNRMNYLWRRAPNFFDVVHYTGNATAGLAVDHNLGVVPEMMVVKARQDNASWHVYHSGMGNTKTMNLNGSGSEQTSSVWNNTTPTDTQFTVGSSLEVNGYNKGMIAYLFATLSGVSKCGSYSGSSSAQNIDCGFSSGARFILIKCTSANDNWQVYDAERGIVAGNDPYLQLDTNAAEVSNSDDIDPYSSGFTLVGNRDATNAAGRDYIFYAIA